LTEPRLQKADLRVH